jgi:hypothetical protein
MQIKLISVLKRIVILADFKTVEKKFLTQTSDTEEVQKYLKTFKQLRDQNRISDKSKKDIEYWGKKEFSQFKDFVDTLTATKSKRNQKKSVHKEAMNIDGAKLIAENEDWLVYMIHNHSACKLLGSRNWCIVRDSDTWDQYTEISQQDPSEDNNYFYFILAKDRPEDEWYKIAVQATSDDETIVWDALDNDRSWRQFKNETKSLNIPDFRIEFPESKCTSCGNEISNCHCCSICGGESGECGCCGNCENTVDDCTCCPICDGTDRENCGCCSQCDSTGRDCTCCKECGNTKDECTCCSDCGYPMNECTCSEEEEN